MDDDFPKTAMEFEQRFGREDACRRYLLAVRWPAGFVCPRCGGRKAWTNVRHLLACADCGYQASLTAGTVMEGTRKPLTVWFKAMWWVCTQKTGGSAKGLQRLLGLGSYQTAWAWLHKLRRAMIRAGREPLQGPVEVDDTYIGGFEEGVSGRETTTKAKVVVAVEIEGPRKIGRVRFQVVPDMSAKSLVGFVQSTVEAAAQVVTDGWEGYHPLAKHGYEHKVLVIGHDRRRAAELLPHVHLAMSLVKRWLLGTHQGAVDPKHLQHYLDEFAFRFNRRKSRHVGKIFYRMLQGATGTEPTPYWQLVGRSAPDQPLQVVGT